VDDRGRGQLAMYRTSRNEKKFVSESDPPPPSPVHGRPDSNICCVSDVFSHDTGRTSLNGREGGEGVFQTDDVGQGGESKSQFWLGRL